MPGRDGTGPVGGGGMGRGMGRGKGGGMGRGMGAGMQGNMGKQTGSVAGQMAGTAETASRGYCVCPQCGVKVPHQQAQACTSMQCPQCGTAMVRE